MNHYDVIVVGAGPSGGVAAHELARNGARVALLERQTLPRHKTCGGGMPLTVAKLLEFEELRDLAPEAFVEAETRYFRHTFRFASPHLAAIDPVQEEADRVAREVPKAGGAMDGVTLATEGDGGEVTSAPAKSNLALWMVQRSVFDNALAQRAVAQGAELFDGVAVRSLEIGSDGRVRVLGEGRDGQQVFAATADTVVGADGANGIVARTFGLRRKRSIAIAIEAEVPHRWGDGHPDLRPDVCHLEYGAVKNGYAWVFPKADHLNVGAGVFRTRRNDGRGDASVRTELHAAILAYLEMLGVPKREEELTFHAHPLPMWNGLDTLQTPDNRVLLAGDAAGLINPIFGDGIYHALKSGKIAAMSILERRQAEYTRLIGEEFRANFDAALQLSKVFYQFPGIVYRHGVTRAGASRQAVRLLNGDLRFDNITKRVYNVLFKAMQIDKETDKEEAPPSSGAGY